MAAAQSTMSNDHAANPRECVVMGRDAKIERVIGGLLAAFPLAFSTEPRHIKPLAVGIRQQINARCSFSHRGVSEALWRYTRRAAYLRTIIEGAVRVDLDGATSGTVTAMEAAHAAEQIMTSLAIATGKPKEAVEPNTPAKANISQSAPIRDASKSGPRRFGLADLRRAAAARRNPTSMAR
jgi:sRNA-binding protein